MRDSSYCSAWLPQTLAVDLRPTPAAEFPNDNPALHHGARWVCLRTRGASRAVWRWAGDSSPHTRAVSSSAESASAAPSGAADSAWPPSPFALAPPDPLPEQPPRPEPEESLPLVLDIDPSRIVLPQRVADLPPPPAFVFRPFRRTRPEVTVDPERPVSVARMLDVSSSEAGRTQVRRGSRVDVAPCIGLQPSAPPVAPALTFVASEVSEVSETEPAPRIEPERRRSRRAAPARRGPITSSSGEELEQAILELESAFGERVALAAP
ncbi:MAG: hypothetical protein ABW217_15565 [Polyangiaceae bacterium]